MANELWGVQQHLIYDPLEMRGGTVLLSSLRATSLITSLTCPGSLLPVNAFVDFWAGRVPGNSTK